MEENRIEAGIREWSGHSKRLSDLFGDSITEYPNIKKVQLSHFRDVAKRQLPDISKEEKTMLRVLKGEITRMEKALYPSLFMRIVRRIGRVIIPKPSEPVKPTTSQLTIQEPVRRNVHSEVEAKREIRPARTLEKKERVKHDLLPKNKSRQGKGIKR
jgi:cell division protein FtsL